MPVKVVIKKEPKANKQVGATQEQLLSKSAITPVAQNKENLPNGWRKVNLGEVANYINGKAFKTSEWSREGLPIIRIQNLNREKSEFNYCNFEVDEKYFVNKGDLLFAWSGTPDTSFGAHVWKGPKAVLNQHIFRIVVNEKIISKRYYLYALNHKVKEFVNKAHGTAGLAHITKSKFEESEIYLPSLPEQYVIVSKIEELLSELDKGKQQLETAQQQLKIYRQAVLKWAFEGKQLFPFGEFVKSSQNGLSKRKGTKGIEFKVLRLADITMNVIDSSNPRKIVMDEDEITKYKIKKDELICIRVNGSKDLVGKLIYVSDKNENDNWAFCDHFIKFTLDPQKAFAAYFGYYFSTVIVRKYIHDNMVTSAGQNTVSQGTIKNVLVPSCTIEEQQLIVQEIESRLSVCDKVEETITTSLAQAETLRQSILKKAFEGKLVDNEYA